VTTVLAPVRTTTDLTERLGRVALATQGVLYLVVGVIAGSLALGDHGGDKEASQRGAIESVARQPFGRVLLVVLLAGLVAHSAWRVLLAVRGEPGPDDDGKSIAKRAANLGRGAIYLSLSLLAFRLLTTSSGGDSSTEKESTARVLDWPAGQWLVIVAGLAIIAVGLWHMSKVVTAAFLEDLDLGGLTGGTRRAVEVSGRVGYAARGAAFGLVGWFLLVAGVQHDPSESRGLDESLRELLGRPHGPWLLGLLALGLVLFGSYRLLDSRFRKPSAIVHA
jgi:hypothetical protein